MKPIFQKETEYIYRLCVPFEDIFTSVFLVEGELPILIDSGTTKEDVHEILLPALAERGIHQGTKGYLLATHRHADHNGGAEHLLKHLPCFEGLQLTDGDRLGVLTAYALPGHSKDSTGYLDNRTGTLICGDALQFYGVGRYGCGVGDATAYERSMERMVGLGLNGLLPSHAYVGGAAAALGREAVEATVGAARQCWARIKAFVQELGAADPEEIARVYAMKFSCLPPLPSSTVRAVLAQGRDNGLFKDTI